MLSVLGFNFRHDLRTPIEAASFMHQPQSLPTDDIESLNLGLDLILEFEGAFITLSPQSC